MRPDIELALMRAITTLLPRVRGSGRIPNLLKTVYARKPRPPVIANVRGFSLRLRPSEFVDGWLLFGAQFWDEDEIRFIQRNLPRGGVFLDIGAYIGLYALVAARVVGSAGKVLAVEADPRTFDELKDNVERNQCANIRTLHVGVSDRVESLRLALTSQTNTAANSFIWQGTEFQIDEGTLVPCRPLADILRDEGIERVDGAKLDIEGFEFRVLKEFFRVADASLFPRFLIVEHFPEWVSRAGGDTLVLLADHGYREVAQHSVNHILIRDG